MTPEHNALRIHADRLEKQNEQMRQLATLEGFIKMYFKEIPISKTNEEAFHKVNDLHFSLFDQYRYSDMNSFKAALNYHNKKK